MKEKMSVEAPAPKLVYPPIKEDLRRLYVDEKLSAMKIARVYELDKRYASPKTAESTILYHLKRLGIVRRDAAEHVRKVTPAMVDEWVTRYQSGESVEKIAGESVSPGSLFLHLHKRGLQLRDKAEAVVKALTKHPKRPFDGTDEDMAYIVGFAKGDLWATTHGRAVRVKTATTHPKMTELVRTLFASHGAIYEYPRIADLTGYEWSIDCDLDKTYDFLLRVDELIPKILADDRLFWFFLAGFFDAEGTIFYHRKGEYGAFELTITNLNDQLLKQIASRLSGFGIFCVISKYYQSENSPVKGGPGFCWRLQIWRYRDVARMLHKLRLRHPEKIDKCKIALKLPYRATLDELIAVEQEWDALREEIERGVAYYIDEARRSIVSRREKKS